MQRLRTIFASFFKIGLFTFGGGYAMLPILQRDIVEKYGWATEEEVMDYYAMAQCLPGIIMINTSAFIGQHRKGTLGGFVAGFASAFPSLVIITIIAAFLTRFAEYPVVQNAFAGIRACVVVLIVNALVKLWKSAIVDWKALVIVFAPVFALSAFTDASPILLVVAAAVAGIVISSITAAAAKKKGGEGK